MCKRKAGVTLFAVPHVADFSQDFKVMPKWLLERIFPESDDEIKESQWSSTFMHLCAMNYYVIFAAKRHYDLMEYVGRWLQRAFKLFQWYGDQLQDVQASFIRKQTRVVSHLLRKDELFELGLHYLGGQPGELSEALWPRVTVTVEELEDIKGVIDSDALEKAFPDQFHVTPVRCDLEGCTICSGAEWKLMHPDEDPKVTESVRKWNTFQASMLLNKKATAMHSSTSDILYGKATECHMLEGGDPLFKFLCDDGKAFWVHDIELAD